MGTVSRCSGCCPAGTGSLPEWRSRDRGGAHLLLLHLLQIKLLLLLLQLLLLLLLQLLLSCCLSLHGCGKGDLHRAVRCGLCGRHQLVCLPEVFEEEGAARRHVWRDAHKILLRELTGRGKGEHVFCARFCHAQSSRTGW